MVMILAASKSLTMQDHLTFIIDQDLPVIAVDRPMGGDHRNNASSRAPCIRTAVWDLILARITSVPMQRQNPQNHTIPQSNMQVICP
jgi:hypothetical protein